MMDSFLEGIGILAIFPIIVYAYKKILEYHDQKGFGEEEIVYRAAVAFSRGAPNEEVENILAGSFCLNKGETDEVLSQALAHRQDKDGGYKAFISSVNEMIGEDVYSKRRHCINRAL